MSRNVRLWCYLNAGLLLFLLFVLVFTRAALAENSAAFCLFKLLFHLYCPFCGGTRAAAALLRLDFAAALRYNAFLTFAAIFAVFYDIKVLIALILRRPRPFWLPPAVWWSLLCLLAAFFIARNALLFAGFDPAGDLLRL